MNKIFNWIFIVSFIVMMPWTFAFALVDPVGSDETHDIATWNWQNFPKDGNTTINSLWVLIQDLELDLICVQEIQSIEDYNQLLNNLDDWDGIYSPDTYGGYYVKTGILYNTDKVTIGEMIQLFDDEDITRPPIQVPVTMIEAGDTLSFNLITLHLKAGGDPEFLAQRRLACELLKEHIEDEIVSGGETKWMIAGDFNDTLDDSPLYNAFTIFLEDDEDWIFLTDWMAGSNYWASHILGGRLIDHFLVTADMLEEYGDGSTRTLRLDDEWDNYEEAVSDHRPVGTFFPGSENNVREEDTAIPGQPQLGIWPVPSNGQINIEFSLPAKQHGNIRITDVTGRVIHQFAVNSTQSYASWSSTGLATGIYFIRLTTGDKSTVRKAVILK